MQAAEEKPGGARKAGRRKKPDIQEKRRHDPQHVMRTPNEVTQNQLECELLDFERDEAELVRRFQMHELG